MARSGSAMTAESVSSDSDLDEQFFDAAPGVKRANSNDTQDREEPVASTSKITPAPADHSPHKRMRMQPPGPPQGVKRAVPTRRLSDRQLQHEQGQQQLSDSDNSFSRQPPPKKRQRGTSTLQQPSAPTPPTRHREASVPALDERAINVPRKRTKQKITRPRASASFNFTPITSTEPTTIQFGLDCLLDKVDEYRHTGNRLYRDGDYEGALAAYNQALDQYPAGAANVPPPLSLLTNRAAAFISLGRWEDALQDMRKAFCYPCNDFESNVKRFTRYIKCLIALGKVDGDEVTEALGHMEDQLEVIRKGTKTYEDGLKAYKDLQNCQKLMRHITVRREQANYEEVTACLDELIKRQSTRQRDAPQEWWLMYIEALLWQGKTKEATPILTERLIGTSSAAPAALWVNALLSFASGDAASTTTCLDQLRHHGELPSQASRLLHKAYSIKGYQEKLSQNVAVGNAQKVLANVAQIVRLADSPISREILNQTHVYAAVAHNQLGNYEAALALFKQDSDYPENEKLRLQAQTAYGTALYHLGRYKEAEEYCTVVLSAAAGNTDPLIREVKQMLQKVLQDTRRKQDEGIEALRNARPHKILGVAHDATKAEIRKAYKAQSLKYHPDKPSGDAERFKLISEAYQTLTATPQTVRPSYARYR